MAMRNWMDELDSSEIEVMRVTIKSSIDADELYGATKQQAKILLNEIDDYLWQRVCQGTPAHLDQFDIELQ